MSDIRICKYCGMELSEGIPHGLRECHLRAVARIAELEALVERLIELGDVINGDKDSVWTLQTIKECWTEDVTKWKEREDSE
jgi:hypothetical protein